MGKKGWRSCRSQLEPEPCLSWPWLRLAPPSRSPASAAGAPSSIARECACPIKSRSSDCARTATIALFGSFALRAVRKRAVDHLHSWRLPASGNCARAGANMRMPMRTGMSVAIGIHSALDLNSARRRRLDVGHDRCLVNRLRQGRPRSRWRRKSLSSFVPESRSLSLRTSSLNPTFPIRMSDAIRE